MIKLNSKYILILIAHNIVHIVLSVYYVRGGSNSCLRIGAFFVLNFTDRKFRKEVFVM